MSETPSPVVDDFDPFEAGAIERVIATSEVQREVWLADQLGTEASLAFNESVSLRMRGTLEVAALRVALARLVQRHPMLRSTVGPDGEELLVGPAEAVPLSLRDLRGHSSDARDAARAAACIAAVETPFALDRGPLFRAELLRLADDDSVLLLTAHHIVCDGWSWGLIAEDLGALYTEALGAGPAPEAAEDYAGYVHWAAAEAAGEAGAQARTFWTARYAGSVVPVLDLPTDRPRPLQRNFASRRVDHRVAAADVLALQRTAAASGVSLFAALLAAFTALLQRLTGQDDVVVGVPAAGQSLSGRYRLVGHCVNLLPMRLAPDAQAPARTLLAACGREMLDAFDHATLSYGSLLTHLPLARDPSRLPLVSVMFNLDQAVKAQFDGYEGLSVELAANARRYENFELFVNAARLADGALRLECQYSTALFDEVSVQRWMRCLETLIRSLAEHPDTALGRLPALAEVDRAELRALQPAFDSDTTGGLMQAAFDAACARHGHRIAARSGADVLTYAELDARANQLAGTLRARGIGRGDRVGLCLERGVDMLAALLAVLRSGAAYVPLDPAFPPARLSYYAEDAQMALLLTQSSLPQAPRNWCADAGARILHLDTDAGWRQAPIQALAPDEARDARPEDPCYVIYTSGSTGRPKGVVIPHRAAANFLAAMKAEPGLAADDRLAAVTTLSFDIAVLELMLPLAVGAQTVIVPRETVTDAPALRQLLEAGAVTVMQATPGLWRMLIDAGWRGGPDFRAFVGGEALPPDLARELATRSAAVWNLYGPTETTVWSTAWKVDLAAGWISIGRPIRNTTVWVLDACGQPCPLGVPGELCIGGDGVSLGYLERPELTAERFIADPFGPGHTLYRTGDRGRWRADGLLEHQGRFDFQVKVRGYRIELGEIEAACIETPLVAEAVVLAREDSPGDVRLVAYLVPEAGGGVDQAALRSALRERLPDYMVPQVFAPLAALPRLPNGKIDRRSLPAPAPERAAAGESSRRAWRDDFERKTAAAMEAVLRLPGIGADDDFFMLGGHSLLGARLVARLSQEFGVRVPMRALLERPTIATLAAMLRESANAPATAPLRSPLVHDSARTRAPLTPSQARMCFVEQMNPDRAQYHTPSAHRLRGPMDVSALQRAFQAVVDRQPALRTRIVEVDARLEQCVEAALPFELPFEDLSSHPEEAREGRLTERLREAVTAPLDIHGLPLFSARLFRLAAQEHVLFFMPHHIVWDGWSFDVFYAEMAAAYEAALADRPIALPPLAVTFADFAAWQAVWLESAECEAMTRRWVAHLLASPLPKAPRTDFPREHGMSGRGRTERLEVPADTVRRLHAVVREAGVTLNALALSLYASLYHALVASPAVVVGVPVRGRGSPELETVMGFFNNLLLLPVAAAHDLSALDMARRVKADLFDAMAVEDLPFERLASQPALAARQRDSGLYQVLFSYQDARERVRDWGELKHENVPVFRDGATEDLGLWLLESSDSLRGGVTYNADLYDADLATSMRDLFVGLLDRVAREPHLPVGVLLAGAITGPAAALRRLSGEPLAPSAAGGAAAGGAATSPGPDRSVPATSQVIAQAWAQALDLPLAQVTPESRFFSLGGSSLQAIQVIQTLQQRLGRRVPAGAFANNPSVTELARTLDGGQAVDSVVVLRPGAGAPPLFLVHDGDGETLLYRQLAERLKPGRAIYGLQPLASPHAALMHRTRRAMVEYYLQRIRAVQPQGPYLLGGLCAGGALAFEVARELERSGQRIGLLALLDANHWTARQKPMLALSRRWTRLRRAMTGVAGSDAQTSRVEPVAAATGEPEPVPRRLARVARKAWGFAAYWTTSSVGRMVSAVRVRRLWSYLQRGDAPPPALRDLRFRDLYEVVHNDTPRDPLLTAGALLVRAADGDGTVGDEPFQYQFEDGTFGWKRVVGGGLRVVDVAGGHSTMLRSPHVAHVAAAIQAWIDERVDAPSNE